MELDALVGLLQGRAVVALTGAGCSTESGIPDYRGPQSAQRPRKVLQAREFLGSEAARRRYWARSAIGWATFAAARPNPAHRALAELEQRGLLRGLITQNVDRLHHAAGSRRVVELHGALAEVRCLGCGRIEDRAALQRRLDELNPGWIEGAAAIAPDGDAEVPADQAGLTGASLRSAAGPAGATPNALAPLAPAPRSRCFEVAPCAACGGVLKPNVVFFGENVPPAVTAEAWSTFDRAEVLLVVGSSLAVFSGYRFVRRAAERGLPIAVVNLGPTRGDSLAAVRLEGRAGVLLPEVARRLLSPGVNGLRSSLL
jgi:NAD-dependent SIR2 family protein deacetylase